MKAGLKILKLSESLIKLSEILKRAAKLTIRRRFNKIKIYLAIYHN